MNPFKTIRRLAGLSQFEFAKNYHIPLKTLQKWEVEDANPTPYLLDLLKDKVNLDIVSDVKQYEIKHPSTTFEKVIENDYLNINKIHPIQQKRVFDLINALGEHQEVKKIIIFGSSVTSRCTWLSDIDIYVELTEIKNVKTYSIDIPVDFWTNFSANDEIKKEIFKKGVVVYDC